MSLRVSVIVPATDASVLRSLSQVDGQSLPADEFEVLLLLGEGVPDATRDLAQTLVEHRANFSIVTGGLREAAEAARGDYVHVLDRDVELAREALERLCRFAEDNDADVCLGRTGRKGGRPGGAALFDENRADAATDDLLLDALGSVAVIRRGLVVDHAADGAGLALGAVAAAKRVSGLADHLVGVAGKAPSIPRATDHLAAIAASSAPEDLRTRALAVAHRGYLDLLARTESTEASQWGVDVETYRTATTTHVPVDVDAELEPAQAALSKALRDGGDLEAVRAACRAARPADPSVTDVQATWVEGDLDLSLSLEQTDGDVRVVVFHAASGAEWPVPDAEVSTADDGRTTVRCRIRPDVLAAGNRLPGGLWRPVVVVDRATGSSRVKVPPAKGSGAWAGERVAVVAADKGQLVVDVDALRTPVVGRLDPAGATVVETARGSELSAPVPQLHLAPGTSITGQLSIDGLPVPAVVRGSGDGATLTAFVSGLAGSYPLSARFSPAPFNPVGVALVIDGSGEMSVAKAAPARKKKAAGPRHAPGGSTRPQAAEGSLRRIARRVPGARAVYRRVRRAD